jgi:hypothetical protein
VAVVIIGVIAERVKVNAKLGTVFRGFQEILLHKQGERMTIGFCIRRLSEMEHLEVSSDLIIAGQVEKIGHMENAILAELHLLFLKLGQVLEKEIIFFLFLSFFPSGKQSLLAVL